MRILFLLPACGLIAACSDQSARRSANAVDVAAAASRGQLDIDNHAASRARSSPRASAVTLAGPEIGPTQR